MAEPTSDAVSTIVIGNFVLNLLLATSLQYLWGMINALQLILHMPLFKVNFPSNTNFVFNQIISVSTFDVIPSEEALEKMFDFADTGPLNDRFDEIDIFQLINTNNIYLLDNQLYNVTQAKASY
eukprot:403364306